MARAQQEEPPSEAYPSLMITDLDWTLWPMDVDTDVTPPFRKEGGKVVDKYGATCPLFPDTRRVLEDLKQHGVTIAYASRTTDGDAAEALLKTHDLWGFLDGNRDLFQAYPSGGVGAKTRHFAEIYKSTNLSACDTIFFDDMEDNVAVASASGVICEMVGRREGLTFKHYQDSLRRWREREAQGKKKG